MKTVRCISLVGLSGLVLGLTGELVAQPLSQAGPPPPPELIPHLQAIAKEARPAPMVAIPVGWFLMGSVRKDDDPYGIETRTTTQNFPSAEFGSRLLRLIAMK